MTTRSNIGRYYDQLTPHERFKLSLLAEACGDTAEAERLTASCPRKTYTMNEAGFTERWQAAFALDSGHAGATGVHFGWLAAIDALAEPMGECIRGLLKDAGQLRDRPPDVRRADQDTVGSVRGRLPGTP